MSDRAPFVRKVAEEVEGAVSQVVVLAGRHVFGGGASRGRRETLAGRSDDDGDLPPYASDDPAVLRRFFGVTEDDWERPD